MVVQIGSLKLTPDQPVRDAALPLYGSLAMEFCNQWASGQPTFTLKTSGSTGKPKEIIVFRKQMEASARQTIRYLGLGAKDTALVALGANYIAGQMMLVRALVANMDCLVVQPSKNPLENIPEHTAATFTALVPLQLQAIIEANVPHQVNQLNNMKAILIGGAPMTSWLIDACQALQVPVYATYGMTETVSHIALRRINGPDSSAYFTVLPDIAVKQDNRGCLAIKGAVTNDQWIVTNDVVEFHDQHSFRWLGRADHVINSGGVKVYAELLEGFTSELLATYHDQPRALLVVPLPHPDYGEQVVLLFEEEKPAEAVIEQIFSRVERRWNRYWVPRQVRVVPRFRRTTNGKVLRKQTVALLEREVN